VNLLLLAHTVLVTGAGQGNGAALAEGLAQLGAHVLVTDIRGESAQATAQRIQAAGGSAAWHALDVADAVACQAAAKALVLAQDHIFVLVNNAGIRPRSTFDAPERDQAWRDAMAVNVDGVRNMILAFKDLLVASKGNVVNIGSISASRASPFGISYSTSKAAAEMLTKVMALELAVHGVRVNGVAPGVMETPMTEESRNNPERRAYLMKRIPMKRFGKPSELVGPVAFLASPMASYVTGAVLNADGGYLAV
jgi:NAD(P)-dependent dehydrogenase (short-subunit alcohol dehydrogenase family)